MTLRKEKTEKFTAVPVLVNNFFIFLRFEEFSGGLEGSLGACISFLLVLVPYLV